MNLLFEWDEKKNKSNQEKHGLSFETAVLVFQDPHLLSVLDPRFEGEVRWISIGRVDTVVIYVAHTVKEIENGEEIIRLISARKTTAREEQRYFNQQ